MGWETPKEWLRQEPQPLRDFNNQWLAFSAEGPQAHDPSITVVFARLEERGIALNRVGFTYVTFDLWQ